MQILRDVVCSVGFFVEREDRQVQVSQRLKEQHKKRSFLFAAQQRDRVTATKQIQLDLLMCARKRRAKYSQTGMYVCSLVCTGSVSFQQFGPDIMSVKLSLSLSLSHTHTHIHPLTHTHTPHTHTPTHLHTHTDVCFSLYFCVIGSFIILL